MEEEIAQYIVKTFMYGEGNVGNDQALFDTGVIDSLGFIKLLSFLENKYNITVAMSEIAIEKFGTIKDITKYIREKQAPSAKK